MFKLSKNFMIGGMAFILISFAAGCSFSSTKSSDAVAQKVDMTSATAGENFQRPQSDDPNTIPQPDEDTNKFLAGNSSSAQSEAGLLVGVWRYQFSSYGYPCTGEDIYQSNGSYSSQWNCNGSILWHTGEWYLIQAGAIRRNIHNYEPKQYLGNPIRMPSGETIYYRFLDRNRLGMAGNIIAYRVQ